MPTIPLDEYEAKTQVGITVPTSPEVVPVSLLPEEADTTLPEIVSAVPEPLPSTLPNQADELLSLAPKGSGNPEEELSLRGIQALTKGVGEVFSRSFRGLGSLYGETRDSAASLLTTPIRAFNPTLADNAKEWLVSPNPAIPYWMNIETFGERAAEDVEDLLPTIDDPTFVEEVLGGVGQVGSQIAIALATGGIGSSVSLFSQGYDITSDKLEQTREAEEQRWEGFAKVLGGSVSAITERYQLDVLMRRIPARYRARIVRMLLGAGSEATQEILEDVGQNLVIMGFDPSRASLPSLEEIQHQGAVAGTVGGLVSAIIPGRNIPTLESPGIPEYERVVFHGTAHRFEGTPDPAENRSPEAFAANGAYYSEDIREATAYAQIGISPMERRHQGQRIIKARVKPSNPLFIDSNVRYNPDTWAGYLRQAVEGGHDVVFIDRPALQAIGDFSAREVIVLDNNAVSIEENNPLPIPKVRATGAIRRLMDRMVFANDPNRATRLNDYGINEITITRKALVRSKNFPLIQRLAVPFHNAVRNKTDVIIPSELAATTVLSQEHYDSVKDNLGYGDIPSPNTVLEDIQRAGIEDAPTTVAELEKVGALRARQLDEILYPEVDTTLPATIPELGIITTTEEADRAQEIGGAEQFRQVVERRRSEHFAAFRQKYGQNVEIANILASDSPEIVPGKPLNNIAALIRQSEIGGIDAPFVPLSAIREAIVREEVSTPLETEISTLSTRIDEQLKEGKPLNRPKSFYLNNVGAWWNKLRYIFQGANSDQLIDDLSLDRESSAYQQGVNNKNAEFVRFVANESGLSESKALNKLKRDSYQKVVLPPLTKADGTPFTDSFTLGELRQRALDLKFEPLRKHLYENEGYTQAIEDAINDELSQDPFNQNVMDAYRRFIDNYWQELDAVYRRVYGVSSDIINPRASNYVPFTTVSRKGRTERKDFALRTFSMDFTQPKRRDPTKNVRVFKRADINSILYYVNSAEYFKAYKEKVYSIEAAFAPLYTKIRQYYGVEAENIIRNDIEAFKSRPDEINALYEELVVSITRNFGFAALGAKPQIGLKQIASFITYGQNLSIDHFTAGLEKTLVNLPKAHKFMMEHSAIYRNRGQHIDKDFIELLAKGKQENILGRSRRKIIEYAMLPIRYGDKGALLIGGHSHIQAMLASGKSLEEAVSSFERITNRTQQSGNPDQIAGLQRAHPWIRPVSQFMSSPGAQFRYAIDNFAAHKRGAITNEELLRRFIAAWIFIPTMITWIGNYFDWEWDNQAIAAVLGPFTGLFFFNGLLQYIAQRTSADVFEQDNPVFKPGIEFPVLEIPKDFIDFVFNIVNDEEGILLEGIDVISSIAGIPGETIANIGRAAADPSLTARERVGFALGFSEWTLEQTDE